MLVAAVASVERLAILHRSGSEGSRRILLVLTAEEEGCPEYDAPANCLTSGLLSRVAIVCARPLKNQGLPEHPATQPLLSFSSTRWRRTYGTVRYTGQRLYREQPCSSTCREYLKNWISLWSARRARDRRAG